MNTINDFLRSAKILSMAIDEWMEKELKEVTDDRLTPSQLKVLKLVDRTEARRIGDVANFLDVSNAAASKAVDRLVRRGLVLREESAADRRAVELSLTAEGEVLLTRYDATTDRVLKKLFSNFDQDQLGNTAVFLDSISAEVVSTGGVREGICLRCGTNFRPECALRHNPNTNCFFNMVDDSIVSDE